MPKPTRVELLAALKAVVKVDLGRVRISNGRGLFDFHAQEEHRKAVVHARTLVAREAVTC